MHLKTKKKKEKSPRPAPTAGSRAPRRRPTSSTAPAAARALHQRRQAGSYPRAQQSPCFTAAAGVPCSHKSISVAREREESKQVLRPH